MTTWMTILLLVWSTANAIEFTSDTCKDLRRISQDIIELELSGSRWQGGDSHCLKQERFKTVIVAKEKVGDAYLLDPDLILPKGREVRIISEKWLDIGGVEVKFAYIGKKNGKDIPIEDQLVYLMNYGKNRERRGCANVSEEPKRFVMRADCAKD